jgi:hypothetical protein
MKFFDISKQINSTTKIIFLVVIIIICIVPTQNIKNRDLDKNSLPKHGAKYFDSFRINYVLVDSKLETNKFPSLANQSYFDKFKSKIMKPVDDYIRKFIKVYRFDINSGSECESTVSDSAGNKFNFRVKMDDYLKGYVSYNII